MRMVNFGCGLNTASGWINFDASPTLRLQRSFVIGVLARRALTPLFPDNATYGDITKGLPLPNESVDRMYCSHVLEHLALEDLRLALLNAHHSLKIGGIFRGVLPDLEAETRTYLADEKSSACTDYLDRMMLGSRKRSRGLNALLRSALGNSQHLWMWDFKGLKLELESSGFSQVRRASFGDSDFKEYRSVEEPSRWDGCLGFECTKL